MNLETEKLKRLISAVELKGRQADFLQRVYAGGLTKYEKRLQAIGFIDNVHKRILDAGSGYGQWTVTLSQFNSSVFALEYDSLRSYVTQQIVNILKVKNIRVIKGSVTCPPFPENYFDAIFSYSVIYQTNWRESLQEFARVLKPDGKLYLSVNGLGWSVFNLLKNPNPSSDFSPRWNAVKAMIKTLARGKLCSSADWILSPNKIRRELTRLKFNSIIITGDGQIQMKDDQVKPPSFYKPTYFGLTNVFEVLATKDD